MAVVDPFIPQLGWVYSLYRGDQGSVDRFLDRIDATLLPDWVRDREFEQAQLRPNQIRCYLYDKAGDAAVRAWLLRLTTTRVRGGAIHVLRPAPSGDVVRIGQLVSGLADGCVLPAAAAAGLRRTWPAFGPRSTLNLAAESLFGRFAAEVDGEWPLGERARVLWDELISGCLVEQVAIDRAELGRWFEDNGWQPEAAMALVAKFFDDSEWLAGRLAAVTS